MVAQGEQVATLGHRGRLCGLQRCLQVKRFGSLPLLSGIQALEQLLDLVVGETRQAQVDIGGFAEFEREQTSERTREATGARAERGLWNGGRLLGYDLSSDKKGHLTPNPDEVALVNFAFDTYLDCGSLKETAEVLNRRGYRTKGYTSRRGVHHPGVEFGISSVQYLLRNPAYVGKKEINKKKAATGETDRYRLVDAVWPAIVDEEKFGRVQRLMAANAHSNHNGSRPVRHAYVLGGLLKCGRCGSRMEGRSGTGRLKVTYYYYVCRNRDCGLRVAAEEIEGAVLDRIRELGGNEEICQKLVAESNKRLQKTLPELTERRRALMRSLDEVRAQADKVIGTWSSMGEEEGRLFLKEKLSELTQRRSDLERGIEETDAAIAQVKREQVKVEMVRSALARVGELYACLKPFEQKELVRLVLRSAEVGDRQIVMELYRTEYLQDEQPLEMATAQSIPRFEPPDWLPGLVPLSVLHDTFEVRLLSLIRWTEKVIGVWTRTGKRAVANEWQEMIRTRSARIPASWPSESAYREPGLLRFLV